MYDRDDGRSAYLSNLRCYNSMLPEQYRMPDDAVEMLSYWTQMDIQERQAFRVSMGLPDDFEAPTFGSRRNNIRDHFIVYEIGAGDGALTRYISEKLSRTGGRLIAIEKDPAMEYMLEELELPDTEIRIGDALDRPIPKEADVLIGNIPYNITPDLIEKLTSERHHLQKVILLVGERFGAQFEEGGALFSGAQGGIDDNDYSRISKTGLLATCYFNVQREFTVDRDCFDPAPSVPSVVLTMTPRSLESLTDRPELYILRSMWENRRQGLGDAFRNACARYGAISGQDYDSEKMLDDMGITEPDQYQRVQNMETQTAIKLFEYLSGGMMRRRNSIVESPLIEEPSSVLCPQLDPESPWYDPLYMEWEQYNQPVG